MLNGPTIKNGLRLQKLCTRCKSLLTDIHSHKWHDEAAARDIGLTRSNPEPIRSIQAHGCKLCEMLRSILQRCPIQQSPDFLDWKFALIVTQFGDAYDSDVDLSTNAYLLPRRYPRWRLGIEFDDGSGNKIRPQVNNVI
jgi:RNA polymerase subunit RPABC4/transcription elongation factor Spt4